MHDFEAAKDADTIQELTRKICIFYSESALLTVHRRDQDFFAKLRADWASRLRGSGQLYISSEILGEILDGAFSSFQEPIAAAVESMDRFEMSVFDAPGAERFTLKKGYLLRRRAYVYRRTMRLSLELLGRFVPELPAPARDPVQAARALAEGIYASVDELEDHANGLLNLHLTILSNNMAQASHNTNEVMRVLTVISVCFMPLNLIAGIYGMNFALMPELRHPWGYPLVLLLMTGTASTILIWFWRRGWLRKAPRLPRVR